MCRPSQFFRYLLLLLGLFFSSNLDAFVMEVPSSVFPELADQPITSIRVYAADAQGKPKPIPFQIDEQVFDRKLNKTVWAVTSGVEAQWGDGKFNGEDALLWLDSDAGGKLSASSLSKAKIKLEVLSDPKSSRYVYITVEDSPAELSKVSYVNYNSSQDEVSTSYYQAGFSKANPIIQNKLVILNQSLKANILDRFKVRIKLGIKNFFDFKIDEDKVSAKLVGYSAGPIRVIRRITAYKDIGPIRVVPKSQTDFIFYPDWIEVPTKIKNPIDGPSVLNDQTQGASGFDLMKSVYGSKLYLSTGTTLANLDGRLSPEEEGAKTGVRWWSLSGPQGAMLVEIKNDAQLARNGIAPTMVLHDDAATPSPPESELGGVFVGFDLPYQKIPKGDFTILVKQVFMNRFAHGSEENYLNNSKIRRSVNVKALP